MFSGFHFPYSEKNQHPPQRWLLEFDTFVLTNCLVTKVKHELLLPAWYLLGVHPYL